MPTTLASVGYRGRFNPVPTAISSTCPRARETAQARLRPNRSRSEKPAWRSYWSAILSKDSTDLVDIGFPHHVIVPEFWAARQHREALHWNDRAHWAGP